MNCLARLLAKGIYGNPVPIGNDQLGDFTQPGYITFAIPWEYDFVNARQHFKKRSFHGALLLGALQYLLIIIFKAQ